MNSRLTIQDLAGLLAERTGKDRNSAEQFLREFIAIVSQGVFTDKVAKIKGLGSFKIVLVEKRESIHVNTGERFLIPAHYKFSFLPDKELRELVNKPFSFFETTELNEDVDFTDLDVSNTVEDKEAEDESVEEILQESEEVIAETPEPLQSADDVCVSEELPEVEQPVEEPAENEPEEVIEESIVPDESSPAENDIPEQTEPETSSDQLKEETKQEPSVVNYPSMDEFQIEDEEPTASSWIKILVSVGVVAIVAIAGIFLYLNRSLFLGSDTSGSTVLTGMSLPGTAVVPEDTTRMEEPEVTEAQPETVEEKDTVSVESVAPVVEPAVQTPKILAKVKIEPGSRLTLISLEYYGSKIFWVYLYEYNKSVIKDPNNVPVGTEIQVPAPELYGIDKHSRASVEKAAARQTEILSGKL
ncbi:HU family DNA-binding protein [uncultured Parabacteroides sp.]|uniref:HU family DNA-binding protein n=1 Tax=uncultured Parabacteroides sp. TaxID=512312 RepID=UPI002592D9BB|nr:HU family DNA-binding protein [uncultured Parabacteroides sp.]